MYNIFIQMWFQGAYLDVPFLLSCFAIRDEKNLPKGGTLKKDCWLEDCRREQFINTGRCALHGSVLINSPVGGNDTELNHSEATSHARSHVLELVVERLAEK